MGGATAGVGPGRHRGSSAQGAWGDSFRTCAHCHRSWTPIASERYIYQVVQVAPNAAVALARLPPPGTDMRDLGYEPPATLLR